MSRRPTAAESTVLITAYLPRPLFHTYHAYHAASHVRSVSQVVVGKLAYYNIQTSKPRVITDILSSRIATVSIVSWSMEAAWKHSSTSWSNITLNQNLNFA